jgi:hypothetical protein
LYSKYYKTANEFEAAIIDCLETINTTKKQKLKSLMALKFQLFDNPVANTIEETYDEAA